ncbi:hypothetical protein OROMI_014147 [Orobanche minor]
MLLLILHLLLHAIKGGSLVVEQERREFHQMLRKRLLLRDELEAQCTQGSFTPEGRHDILAEAIGRPEHPGRVRGIGFGACSLRSHMM